MPLEATVEYNKYANAAMGPITGTGDGIPRGMPPSYSQSTSGSSMPAQLEGPLLNQTPGPSSRPEFNQGSHHVYIGLIFIHAISHMPSSLGG